MTSFEKSVIVEGTRAALVTYICLFRMTGIYWIVYLLVYGLIGIVAAAYILKAAYPAAWDAATSTPVPMQSRVITVVCVGYCAALLISHGWPFTGGAELGLFLTTASGIMAK